MADYNPTVRFWEGKVLFTGDSAGDAGDVAMDIDCCCGWTGDAGSTTGGTDCPDGCPKEISIVFSGMGNCGCVGGTSGANRNLGDLSWTGDLNLGAFIGVPFAGRVNGVCTYGGTLTGSSGDWGHEIAYTTSDGSCGDPPLPQPAPDSVTISASINFSGDSGTCAVGAVFTSLSPDHAVFSGVVSFTGQSACGVGTGTATVPNDEGDCLWEVSPPGHFVSGGQAVVTW